MSQSRLVKTIFQAGPDDQLIVKDVYDSNSSEVVNSYDKTEPEALDVLDPLNGKAKDEKQNNEDTPSDSPDSSDSGGGNDPFSDLNPDTLSRDIGLEEMLDRYGNGDVNIETALREMSDGASGDFDLPDEFANDVYYNLGDKSGKLLPSFPVGDARRLASIVNSLCNGSYNLGITDSGALTNLLARLANMASAMRLPGVLGAVANCFSPDILNGAAVSGINSSLGRGDIGVFNDVMRTGIGGGLRYSMPNIVNQVINGARRPREITNGGLANYYQDARNGLSTVDPNWNTVNRNGSRVFNGSQMQTNPFFMDSVRANVTSQPLNISVSPNGSYGNYIDRETADLSNPAVFESLYGPNVPLSERSRIINEWKQDTGRTNGYNQRQDDSYLLLMADEQPTTVANSLSNDFPYINISTDSSITNSVTYDSTDTFLA